MKDERFRCRNCKRIFPRRVTEQKYCGAAACQRARKREWRQEKYQSDEDYRLNQKASTAAWMSKVGGAAHYYREYRRRKKRVADSSGKKEKRRESKTSCPASLFAGINTGSDISANRDAKTHHSSIKPGRYKMSLSGANRDAFWAEIRVIP